MSVNNSSSYLPANIQLPKLHAQQGQMLAPQSSEPEPMSEEVANAGNTGKILLASGVTGGLAGLVGAYRWKAFDVVNGETFYNLGHANSNTDSVIIENMIRDERSGIKRKVLEMLPDGDKLKNAIQKHGNQFDLNKLGPTEREKFKEVFEIAYKRQQINQTRSSHLSNLHPDLKVNLNGSQVSMCGLVDGQLAQLSKEELDKVYRECLVLEHSSFRDMQSKQLYETQRWRNNGRHVAEFVDEKGKVKPIQKHMDKNFARINEAMHKDAKFQKLKAGAKYGVIAAAIIAPIAYFFVRKKGTQEV